MSLFSERLRQERLTKGFTQKQIAYAVGVTFNCISQYESGVREPSIETIVKLCNILEVSSDYLLGLTNEY